LAEAERQREDAEARAEEERQRKEAEKRKVEETRRREEEKRRVVMQIVADRQKRRQMQKQHHSSSIDDDHEDEWDHQTPSHRQSYGQSDTYHGAYSQSRQHSYVPAQSTSGGGYSSSPQGGYSQIHSDQIRMRGQDSGHYGDESGSSAFPHSHGIQRRASDIPQSNSSHHRTGGSGRLTSSTSSVGPYASHRTPTSPLGEHYAPPMDERRGDGGDFSLPLLISGLERDSSESRKLKTLSSLRSFAYNPEYSWEGQFAQALTGLISLMKDESGVVRMEAMECVGELFQTHFHEFTEFLELTLRTVLRGYQDPDPRVSRAVDQALMKLSSSCDPTVTLKSLAPILKASEGAELHGAIRLLARICQRVESDRLKDLECVLPGLFEAFRNPSADIRKAVVFCLVDLYMTFGNDLNPFLSTLTATQLRLVTVYVQRLRKARKEEQEGSRRHEEKEDQDHQKDEDYESYH
ncbi:hypothetical protein ADUPG1_006775, partial [Aduncisulcus paluster]